MVKKLERGLPKELFRKKKKIWKNSAISNFERIPIKR
jgi:hypothetical protein